jgi:DNA-binding transcriptional MerR regulator
MGQTLAQDKQLLFYVVQMQDKETEGQVYSTAAVAAAAGVPLGTLNMWITRGLFALPKGPGRGRSRLFTRAEAERLALVGELVTALGVSVAQASSIAELVNLPRFRGRFLIVKKRSPEIMDINPVEKDVGAAVKNELDSGETSLIVVDFGAIADRVRAALQGERQP